MEPVPLRNETRGDTPTLTSTTVWWAAHVILPVALGAAIYLLFRSPSLMVFEWVRFAGARELFWRARLATAQLGKALPAWVLFSVPDALWVYALTAGLAAVWAGARSFGARTWIAAGVVLGAGGELGQWIGFVPGTFDFLDLALSSAAYAAALHFTRLPHDPQASPLPGCTRGIRRTRGRKHGFGFAGIRQFVARVRKHFVYGEGGV